MTPGSNHVVNIVIAGIGGQGVVKASDILVEAAFNAGYDVKKSEIHGMSQRGGSVTSDVRFGTEVFSPMTPQGTAHFLVVLDGKEVGCNKGRLEPGGLLIAPEMLYSEEVEDELRKSRMINVGLLGALSAYLDIPLEDWLKAIQKNLPAKVYEANARVFAFTRVVERLVAQIAAIT